MISKLVFLDGRISRLLSLNVPSASVNRTGTRKLSIGFQLSNESESFRAHLEHYESRMKMIHFVYSNFSCIDRFSTSFIHSRFRSHYKYDYVVYLQYC